MGQFEILLTMIGGANLAVLGLYLWSFKNFGRLYELINSHEKKANIHTDKKEFMTSAVCDERHGALKEDVTTIKKDVKCILGKI